MPSQLKSAASRANGAKSRGPKTPEGQERSSRNSLRHGIVARKTILLECENPDQFQAMLEEYAATYQPGNAVEQDLVDEMLSSRWRSGRLSMIVTSLLDMQMNQQTASQTTITTRPDPARPNIRLLIILMWLTRPSTGPEFQSRSRSVRCRSSGRGPKSPERRSAD